MAHIRGSQADNTLMNHLQYKLQTALYFSALDPSLLPVHLQTRRAQLLLEQLPLLDRVARWYGRQGIDIPPEYTVCLCHLQQPETWVHFKQCPFAQGGNHLATWTPEDTIAQHAERGPTAPPTNEVRRLMRQPEIKEAMLRGAVPLQLYRVIADHAPDLKATVRHMQLTAVKRADAQLQHRVQVYAQEAQQTSHDRRMYYNLLIHYQHAQPSDKPPTRAHGNHRETATAPPTTPHCTEAPALPHSAPIVPRTVPLLRVPDGEAPHPRPGIRCGVCWGVLDENGAPLLGHDFRCGGAEQLHCFCSRCITHFHACPLCRQPHPLCTALPPRETHQDDLTLQTLRTLIAQNVWAHDAGDSPNVGWLDVLSEEDSATKPPRPP